MGKLGLFRFDSYGLKEIRICIFNCGREYFRLKYFWKMFHSIGMYCGSGIECGIIISKYKNV